jgi:hypothetical protein
MPPTRDVDEIVKLHAREGSALQEVFVEGSEDKRFYEYFLAEHGLKHVAVLDVGTVSVPDENVLGLRLTPGKKGRVVTLAAMLQGKVTEHQVVCIADADLDHFNEASYPYALLLLTDYTSIELYALCPAIMQRIISVALQGFPKGHVQLTQEIGDLLQDAFLVRVAANDLKLAPTYPDHHSFCSVAKGEKPFSFNLLNYVNKAFENYVDKSWREPLNQKIAEKRLRLKADPRLQIHGHDFAGTLAWYIRQHPGFGHVNPGTFTGLLLGFVDAWTLRNEPLFRELLRRLHIISPQGRDIGNDPRRSP